MQINYHFVIIIVVIVIIVVVAPRLWAGATFAVSVARARYVVNLC